MKKPKLLVIEHDEHTRAVLDEILSTIPCKYEVVTCLAEARKALAQDGHSLIMLADELPARPGGISRMQNPENLLDELNETREGSLPPVVMMANRRPDVDEEDKLRWAADMRTRGVSSFLCKPFRTAGRTPDRVIKRLIAGQTEPVRLASAPAATAKKKAPKASPSVAASAPASKKSEPVPSQASAARCSDTAQWTDIPNEPIALDDFMAKFCEPRSKDNRMCRKRALLAAARHGTVKLPSLGGQRKHGQANKYLTHDLLAAWQGYLDEGVDLPPLLPEFRPGHVETNKKEK